jgi:hypothetical protein
VDVLARELGARLAPLLKEDDDAPHKLTGPRVALREPLPLKKDAVAPTPAPAAKVEPPKEEAKPEPPKAEPPKTEPPKEEPVKTDPFEKLDKPGASNKMPEVLPAYPPSSYHPWGGFVAGRVVAHAIADPPASYVGTGVSATQAFYGFLGRRLRLAVVPTGVGITAPQVAADEGWRSAARAVVMARIDNLEYLPSSMGLSVRLRLQVVVVKEGRTVFRRVVDSPLSDPQRRTDPVYQATSAALEGLISELASVLGG